MSDPPRKRQPLNPSRTAQQTIRTEGSTMPETATSATEPAAEPTTAVPTPPPAAAAPTASWDDLFKGEDPAKVRQALEDSRKWETRSKENAEKAKQYDALEQASKSELEKAQDAAAKAAQRATASDSRAVKAEIRSLAAGRFIDRDVPFAYLGDPSKYIVDGEVNEAAIAADLDALLTRVPALGASQDPGKRTPAPNPAQGSSASGPAVAGQLTKDDLTRMHKAGQHEEIAKARAEGRFDQLLGVGQ